MTVPPPGDAAAAPRVAGPGPFRRLLVATTSANLADGLMVVAVPWLASAITRDPVSIALVTAATRLPWLLFSLPVGAITDRFDRRRLVGLAATARAVLLLGFALLLVAVGAPAADPSAGADPAAGAGTGTVAGGDHSGVLLAGLVVLALLVGLAEVVGDNSAQTLIPSLVPEQRLTTANGRLWAAETVANQFVGPPLAGLLIAVGIALPFFVGAGGFAVAAAMVFTIAGSFRPPRSDGPPTRLSAEIAEGVRWLMGHRLLRSLAISLGVLNAASAMGAAVFVLFGQEVAGLDATGFGLLMTGSAVGAVLGGIAGPRLIRRWPPGTALAAAIVGMGAGELLFGLLSQFAALWAVSLVTAVFIVVWNVITVSLRQSLIPDRLLGRVNSVYRFFGWGTIAIGTLLGGLVVWAFEPVVGREWAVRLPFLLCGLSYLLLLAWAWPRINNEQIARARAQAGEGGAAGADGPLAR
jgi:MFS family permease